MHDKVNWGILGAGTIAQTFAAAAAVSRTAKIVAVASRSKEKADSFANQFQIPHRHGSYEAILDNKEVQALYIATPHPLHLEWAVRAADAGKHLIVEKPLAMNLAQAQMIIDAAKRNNVFLTEAFMYRCHPQTAKLVELLKQKCIGEVRVIQATFGFHAPFNPAHRLFDKKLGGGAILDIGCYPVSIARLIAGAEPIEVQGVGHLGSSGVDEWAIACLRFPRDVLAQLSTSLSVNQKNIVKIFGSDGYISLPNPFQINRTAAEPGSILVHKHETVQKINVEAAATSFTYEIDLAGDAILLEHRQVAAPGMSWEDSLGNMRVLDSWRRAIQLSYECDERA